MTMFDEREFVKVLPDDELLESQRAVFALSEKKIPIMGLGGKATNLMGEVAAYDMQVALIERHGSSPDKNPQIWDLARLAHRLISYDPQKATFGGYNSDFVNIRATIFDSMGEWYGGKVFTPTGFVHKIEGELKQKVVQFEIRDDSRYAGDEGQFNFSSEQAIRLYADNLGAASPLWEYQDRGGSDILPGNTTRPFGVFHYPRGFENEELALSVIGSLARVVDAADRY